MITGPKNRGLLTDEQALTGRTSAQKNEPVELMSDSFERMVRMLLLPAALVKDMMALMSISHFSKPAFWLCAVIPNTVSSFKSNFRDNPTLLHIAAMSSIAVKTDVVEQTMNGLVKTTDVAMASSVVEKRYPVLWDLSTSKFIVNLDR
mgnify:CR=1 FL=1